MEPQQRRRHRGETGFRRRRAASGPRPNPSGVDRGIPVAFESGTNPPCKCAITRTCRPSGVKRGDPREATPGRSGGNGGWYGSHEPATQSRAAITIPNEPAWPAQAAAIVIRPNRRRWQLRVQPARDLPLRQRIRAGRGRPRNHDPFARHRQRLPKPALTGRTAPRPAGRTPESTETPAPIPLPTRTQTVAFEKTVPSRPPSQSARTPQWPGRRHLRSPVA